MGMIIEQRAAAEKCMQEEDDPQAPRTFLMTLLRNQNKSPASLTDRELNTHAFGNVTAGKSPSRRELHSIGDRAKY